MKKYNSIKADFHTWLPFIDNLGILFWHVLVGKQVDLGEKKHINLYIGGIYPLRYDYHHNASVSYQSNVYCQGQFFLQGWTEIKNRIRDYIDVLIGITLFPTRTAI